MRTLWIVAVLLVGVEGSLVEFGRMIKEETGEKTFPSYTFYGCYSAAMHDCCYGKVTGCDPKIDPTLQQGNGVIVCGGGTWCKKQICECDKAAATCLRDNLDTYNKEYQFYEDFRCKEGPKKC
ncbi:Phospholipase A2, group IIG [Bothrops jararaca]|uniref:Phospholipase A2, group IIG n=1 Tax=Bothrops jararaca TaxID=8724 RepID=A0A8T1N4W2_BOTJA|nr:Phospholipase A2, group IIG [Bothrops jararaca]